MRSADLPVTLFCSVFRLSWVDHLGLVLWTDKLISSTDFICCYHRHVAGGNVCQKIMVKSLSHYWPSTLRAIVVCRYGWKFVRFKQCAQIILTLTFDLEYSLTFRRHELFSTMLFPTLEDAYVKCIYSCWLEQSWLSAWQAFKMTDKYAALLTDYSDWTLKLLYVRTRIEIFAR